MKPIRNWRKAYRLWSIRLNAIGTALASVLIASPDAALATWNAMPQEFKQAIPPNYMPLIGLAFCGLSIFARLIRQEKFNDKH